MPPLGHFSSMCPNEEEPRPAGAAALLGTARAMAVARRCAESTGGDRG